MTQPPPASRLLVVELWGLGDLALAVPFLRAAAQRSSVTLLAQPHAAPIVRRFVPTVEHVALIAPWTAFRGKYRLHRWPWRELGRVVTRLRAARFDAAVSVRHDPRDHGLLWLSGARVRLGFPRLGSHLLLTGTPGEPSGRHRTDHWQAVAGALGLDRLATTTPVAPNGRHVVIHTGAGKAARIWPRERFAAIAGRLVAQGWRVTVLDDSLRNLDRLLTELASADRFIGNDSGPGHLAALLGVPTFTLFGPSEPEIFAPAHRDAQWLVGASCVHRPCADYCRFERPRCIEAITVEDAWARIERWLTVLGSRT